MAEPTGKDHHSPMGSNASRTRSPGVGLPPSALAPQVHVEQKRRELARALPKAPLPRPPRITARLDILRVELARYREQAIVLHAKLVQLEAHNNVESSALRRMLIDSSVKLEEVVRALIDSPCPPPRK
ncbi:MAG: hypothetical protein H6Q90_6607 [Deltaproteobacteria bacterium]|nr:hypothetical protein [Deltaproteobacteria bacterium]